MRRASTGKIPERHLASTSHTTTVQTTTIQTATPAWASQRAAPPPPPVCLPPTAGDALLVAPVLKQGAQSVQVVLPGGGAWYSATDGAAIDASVEAKQAV